MATDESRSRRGRKKEASITEILQRRPPFDLEAEMGVLGSILLLPEVCDEIGVLEGGRLL